MQVAEPHHSMCSFFVSPLRPSHRPLWSACAVLLAGCVLGGTACATPAPVPNTGEAPIQWPRLFYSSAQRAAIARARYADQALPVAPEAAVLSTEQPPPALTTFALQGFSQGSQGASAWINGLTLRHGDVLGGRTVLIEQHTVRLRQKGLPDLVLRPGQSSLDPDQPVVDVVPAGIFGKK